jgi:hypothetical protein
MAKKKRTAAEISDDAEANGLQTAAESGINGDEVHNPTEDGTELN